MLELVSTGPNKINGAKKVGKKKKNLLGKGNTKPPLLKKSSKVPQEILG